MNYHDFITQKLVKANEVGMTPGELHHSLYPFQRLVTERLLKCGRGAAFLDTGLGKTLIQLVWADEVQRNINGVVLILTPLAVANQTQREAKRFGIKTMVLKAPLDTMRNGIYITNYDSLHHWDDVPIDGVVLDESSILKSLDGKTRMRLTERFSATPFRLCCTATPAPNDLTELGNHAEFLGVMTRTEMQSRWFVNDLGETGSWRLKGHSVKDFWRWVSTWACCGSKPSDFGSSDEGFVLPPLNIKKVIVEQELQQQDGFLFALDNVSASGIFSAKRDTAEARAKKAADLIASYPKREPVIIWVDTNFEADCFLNEIPSAIEVRGDMDSDDKEERIDAFSTGKSPILISKPSICGFGLNWQHCNHVIFGGVTFSYETFYQAVRRCWRYGQEREVTAYVLLSDSERAAFDAITNKSELHNEMKRNMMFQTAFELNQKPQLRNHSNHGKLPNFIGA